MLRAILVVCQQGNRDPDPTTTTGLPCGSVGKNLPAKQKTWVHSLGWEDPLEEGMATHSSILAWKIPMDRGARQAAIYGVAKSRTQLITPAPLHLTACML